MTEHRPSYETEDLAVRPVVMILIVTAVAVPLASLALWLGLQTLTSPPAPDTGPAPPALPRDQPPLQTDPPGDYSHYHQRLSERLHGLGWIDREAGIVHIPIEEAMTHLLERGLPDSTQPNPQSSPLSTPQSNGGDAVP